MSLRLFLRQSNIKFSHFQNKKIDSKLNSIRKIKGFIDNYGGKRNIDIDILPYNKISYPSKYEDIFKKTDIDINRIL